MYFDFYFSDKYETFFVHLENKMDFVPLVVFLFLIKGFCFLQKLEQNFYDYFAGQENPVLLSNLICPMLV